MWCAYWKLPILYYIISCQSSLYFLPLYCSIFHASPFMIDATEDSEKSSKHLLTPTSTSFRQSLIYLFGKDDAKLCKSSSQLTQKLASHSCHISFLKTCRDHNLIPKGLRLTDPIMTQRSQQVVTEASSRLITERLNHFRPLLFQKEEDARPHHQTTWRTKGPYLGGDQWLLLGTWGITSTILPRVPMIFSPH